MVEKTSFLAHPGESTIVITRVFDAPRELVFEAWTRPEHVARWWGPRGSTLAVCEIDLRVGGAYRFVQRGSDGGEYPFKGVYREIVAPERLVYTQIFDVEPWSSSAAIINMTFAERSGRTTMTTTCVYESVEVRDGHLQSGMEAGAIETLERLAEHLPAMAAAPK